MYDGDEMMGQLFNIGTTYKFMLDQGFEKSTILTITVEYEDELFVKGKDKNNILRGIKKSNIDDWMELEQETEILNKKNY
jgi:hypothetical protein